MDVVNACCGLKQAQLSSRVQMAVAKKALDAQAQSGTAMLELLNAASQSVSEAGDQLVAAATGLGGAIDTYG